MRCALGMRIMTALRQFIARRGTSGPWQSPYSAMSRSLTNLTLCVKQKSVESVRRHNPSLYHQLKMPGKSSWGLPGGFYGDNAGWDRGYAALKNSQAH